MSENSDNLSTQSFDALLNATVDAIIVINGNGEIEVFNKAAERIFGYEQQEVLGQKINLLMPEPFSSEHDEYMDNFHRSQKPKIIGIGREVSALRKNGDIFPIDLAVGKIKDTTKVRYVGIVRDISDRKQIEDQLRTQDEELHQQREKLAHVSRVGTMGEMATGIAHEINQPLTAITTYAQACSMMLNDGNINQTELAQTLDKISAQAERAGEVIRRLRSFLKKSTPSREQCCINELIVETIKMAEIDSRLAGIRIETNFCESIDDVNIDTVQIQQVVLNLIRNGIDAMNSNTNSADSEPGIINIATTQADQGQSVKVSVSDQGLGLDKETSEHIFDPFFTTKATGMGMGLAICRSIIQEHGGKMWFEDDSNESGTRFSFVLPTIIKE